MFRAHRGQGWLRRKSVKLAYSDFADLGAATGQVDVSNFLPKGTLVYGIAYNVTTAFSGGAAGNVELHVGVATNEDGWTRQGSRYLSIVDVKAASWTESNQPIFNPTAVRDLRVQAEVTSGTLDFSLIDQGEVEITLFLSHGVGF